jgi:osmotically-inducible protein OsmY
LRSPVAVVESKAVGRPDLVVLAVVVGASSSALASCSRRGEALEATADPAAVERSSERLEREVRAKLTGDPHLTGAGSSIVVIVDGKNVVLEGWVASANQRTMAEADAVTVAGAAGVDDRLLVRRSEAPEWPTPLRQ